MPLHSPRQLEILLIESNPADAALTREALKEAGLHKKITTLEDGVSALAYLRREAQHASAPIPEVIFLDLGLPRKPGLEVLAEIKRNPQLAVIPVVVVSGSSNPQEVREAYELHASCYVKKPSDLQQFLSFMRICYEFWGLVVTLPPQAAATS